MRRRAVLGTLGTLVAGCSSRRRRDVEPTGPVEPAGDIASVETVGEGVVVTMVGVGDTDYARTTIEPMQDPERPPLALSGDQITEFPVLRNGLAYFSYDYKDVVVRSRIDDLRFQDWLRSYWDDRRDANVLPPERPFSLEDAVFSAWATFYV